MHLILIRVYMSQAGLIDVDDPAAIRPSPVLHVWEVGILGLEECNKKI